MPVLARLIACACLIVHVLLIPSQADAQSDSAAARGVIAGRVVAASTEAPVTGAVVQVRGTTRTALSDADGRFVVRDVPVGVVALEVRAVGYLPIVRSDVVVSPAKPAELVVRLRAVDNRLRAVLARPEAFPVQPPVATPVSTQSYSAEEVRRQPGAQEDVLRAISIAPGVGVTNAARNDIVVRGGAPFENLFVVDHIEVPNINHFGSQGSTGGPISLINIRFIESASISAGGFGAPYGDRTSSATLLTLREGNRERLAGELNVAASQVGAVVEGPIGSEATFFANIRQSYLDLLFKAIGLSFIPSYTDATFKAVWRPTSRDAISALAIVARGTVSFANDSADDRLSNAQVLAPSQDQYFSGLTWSRLLSRGVVTTTLGRTWTRFVTAQSDTLLQPIFASRSTEGETSLRTEVRWSPSAAVDLEAGTRFKYASTLEYDATLTGALRRDANGTPQPLRVDTSFTALQNGSWMQAAWQAWPTVRLSAGVRADWYGFLATAVRVAPRLSASWTVGDRTTVTVAGGRYWQPPSYIWLVGDPENVQTLRPFRADQVVLGVTRRVGEVTKLQFEVYGKRYADYPTRRFRPQAVLSPSGFDDATTDIPFGLEPLSSEGLGSAVGAEVLVQRRLGELPLYGQLSASWNHTRFTGLDGLSRRGAFDTPWLANGVLGWRPDSRWELAIRTRAASGLPITPFVTTGSAAGSLDFTRYNADRLTPFFATDVRVDRRFVFGRQQLIGFLDLQNVTGRRNAGTPRWNPRLQRVEYGESIGLLPTIGLNWEF